MPTYYIPIPENREDEIMLDQMLNGMAHRWKLEQSAVIRVVCDEPSLEGALRALAEQVINTPPVEKKQPEVPVKKKPASRSAKREEGLRLLREGELSQAEIANKLKVSPASVSGWKKLLEEQEEQGEPDSETPGNGGAHHVTVVSRDASSGQSFSQFKRGAIKGRRLG